MTDKADLIFLIAALPFCFWAAITDLRSMKILNVTNISLFATFCILGALLFPIDVFAVRIAQGAFMLAVGFMLTSFGLLGGGDSKFIAAMAPFIAMQDVTWFVMLLAALSLATVLLHRLVGAVGPIKARLGAWKSWDAGGKFPYGVTLASALVCYLSMNAFQ